MADIEVHIDIEGRTRPVGLVRSKVRPSETVVFEYAPTCLTDPIAPLSRLMPSRRREVVMIIVTE